MRHSPLGLLPDRMAARSLQYAADSSYFSLSSGTPLPPSSGPNELRMIVMGCIQREHMAPLNEIPSRL